MNPNFRLLSSRRFNMNNQVSQTEQMTQNVNPTQLVTQRIREPEEVDLNYPLSQNYSSLQLTQNVWNQNLESFDDGLRINNLKPNKLEKNKNLVDRKVTLDMKNEYDIVNKPTLKLTHYILNNFTHEHDVHRTHYITPYGMKDSLRLATDGVVKFGRMSKDEGGNVINDITIEKDNTVSRNHCRIEVAEGFKKVELMPEAWVSLLMMTHHRLGKNINVPSLTSDLIFNIFTYMGKKRQFYLVDTGSTMGTYIKLQHKESYPLKKHSFFLLGCDIFLTVKDIVTVQKLKKPNFSLISRLIEEAKTQAEIIGDIPKGLGAAFSSIAQGDLDIKNELLKNFEDFKSPYIKLEVHKFNTEDFKSYILVYTESKSDFIIGRANLNDLRIDDSTISREQSRILYCPKENKWWIRDGSEVKESLNGTWLSINNSLNQFFKNESERFPIKHGDYFKISDSVFKIEELNTDKYYNL